MPSSVSRETSVNLSPAETEQVEVQIKYEGYIARQQLDIDRQKAQGGQTLPINIDYLAIDSLSYEARQKLQKHRPETFTDAAKISGITPATIASLMIHLKRLEQTNNQIKRRY